MKTQFQPWQFLLLILAGWINRRQQDAVEYLLTENRVLREKLGKNRILLNDDQRRRLAVKGKTLGRKMLEQLATIVSPDTILRWHRELVARHWNCSGRRKATGRPAATPEIVELVLRRAKSRAGSDWAGCCGTTAAKRPDLGRHLTPAALPRLLMRCVQVTTRVSATKRRRGPCARPPLETEVPLHRCRAK